MNGRNILNKFNLNIIKNKEWGRGNNFEHSVDYNNEYKKKNINKNIFKKEKNIKLNINNIEIKHINDRNSKGVMFSSNSLKALI